MMTPQTAAMPFPATDLVALTAASRAARALSPKDRALLERLRDWARAAQRGPRADLDRACALIDAPSGQSAAVHGAALVRALDACALRPMPFHPRGAEALAFGEAWALRLISALGGGDSATALFLVGRCVRRERRRLVLWLAARAADGWGVATTPEPD